MSFAPKDKADAQPQQQSPQQEQQYPQNYNQHTAYREQPKQMPDRNSLPTIDIDEDEIPF